MIQIAFVNGKGGVGKTTCAMLMAAAFKNAGQTLAVDDRDPQRSATTIAKILEVPLGNNAPIVIIDTPPSIHARETTDAVAKADLVVLVTTPRPIDLATTATTASHIKTLRTGPTWVLFNLVQTNNRFFETMPAIAKEIPFPAFKNFLTQRTAYQAAEIEGWRVIPAVYREELIKVASEIALALRG